MMPLAVDGLLDKLAAVGVSKPEYVFDDVQPGYFEGTLFLRQEDDWNATARTVLSYLFGLARQGELPVGVEQVAINQLLPHLALPCSGQQEPGTGGRPACTAVITWPPHCVCYRPTGKVG